MTRCTTMSDTALLLLLACVLGVVVLCALYVWVSYQDSKEDR